ncbi:hypothetical protein O6H91_08G041200 [Diphasiastrum complanatum]|uniref:Uncharacterized protein n=1 Tax=Diphasiastrum complanatum TaxID=34168 RepID=A0ACC2CWZ1_DIPCM|nr:hypothetical protein O6H91_08G041200 [Diphasiastrum complanatum]
MEYGVLLHFLPRDCTGLRLWDGGAPQAQYHHRHFFFYGRHRAPSLPCVASASSFSDCQPVRLEQKRRVASTRPEAAFPWGCDVESLESGQILQEWLSSQGLPPQKMELQRVEAGGRGLVAQRKLRKGERLLYVPSSLIITTQSEWSSPKAGNVLQENGVPEWPQLASFLISEASQGKNSPWSSYIAALPQQPRSILQWTALDVDTYLAGSSIKDRALECIKDVNYTYHDLQERIFSRYPELFPSKVRLPSAGQQLALVPWADMLNHSTEVNAFLDVEASSKTVILELDRAYEKGEQVLISYGKRSNAELLLSYGFIPAGPNTNDFVEVEAELDPRDEMFTAKLDALQAHGLSSPQRFPVKLTGLPMQLLAFARLAVSTSMQTQYYSQMAIAATEKGLASNKQQWDFDLEDKIKAFQFILTICEASISNLTRFLKGKEDLLGDDIIHRGTAAEIGRQPKAELAVALCNSERTILYRAQHVLRMELLELRAKKSGSRLGSKLNPPSFGPLEKIGNLFGVK